ncbi:hypothetical protein [Polymorphospora rubra]|uniref:Uncharacterized protein n=1 Tax=Polymorphospora rubra TaxID=338584 RepID=A0A810NA04_9ACTN|nr:hypothetical protein [Polymorphospora rubra]BCJ70067.1 hypothetical protein Prubr_70880 [Polymorphospora rubra]
MTAGRGRPGGVRVALAAAGTAVMGYGGWLLVREVEWTPAVLLSLAAWLVTGPPAHDLLLAPLVAVTGVLVARLLPRPWRTMVVVGLFATGTLLLVGTPLLTRPSPAPPNPGLDDRNYLPGLLAYLGVLWAVLFAVTATVALRRRRRARRSAQNGS